MFVPHLLQNKPTKFRISKISYCKHPRQFRTLLENRDVIYLGCVCGGGCDTPSQGRSDRGVGGGCDTPPENELSANEGICRQTKNNIPKTLSNIRFTVRQYWIIIKKNGTNSANFGKFVSCLEKF